MELELQLWKCNYVIPLLFIAHFPTYSPERELPQHMRGRCFAPLSLADLRLNKYLPAYYYLLLATPARTMLCYAVLSGVALPDRSDAGMSHGRSAAEPR